MSAPISEGMRSGPLEDRALTGYQLLIVGLTVLMAVLDGFDAFSMAYVAPVVSREWHLDKAVVGLLLSSGFAGMAIGSFVISPVADVRGRRPVILGGLFLMTVGSLLSALAQSVALLTISRVVTGLGMGAMVTLTTSIAAEFANARYRALIVSAVAQGFPAGNILGGLATAGLLRSLGWRSVFFAGGFAGIGLFAALTFLLLESPVYLATCRTADALPKLNRVLSKLGHQSIARLAAPPRRERTSYAALFADGAATVTVRLILVNMLLMATGFYLLSWLPQFIASSGFTPTSAAIVAATTASSGVLGGLLIGGVATIVKSARLAAVAMVVTGVATVAVGLMPPDLVSLAISAAVFGIFFAGSTGLLYARMAEAFPPLARTSGIGLLMGAGRIAGAAGPALAGVMFAAGWGRWQVSALFAAGPVLAGVILAGTKFRQAGDPR